MTTNELIGILRGAKQDSLVYFDFCGCVPTTIASWRGIYAEPALGWAPGGWSGKARSPAVAMLLAELEKSIDGREYSGWKGGEYCYTGNEPLHVDNPGDCTDTNITHVTVIDYRVVIHTNMTFEE